VAEVISARVGDDLIARIDSARGDASRGAWLADLITRQLDSTTHDESRPPAGLRTIGPGIPAPGVMCMWPACFIRDSDRYGATDPAELTRTDHRDRSRDEDKAGIALCKHHAATLEGRTYTAPRPDFPATWRKQPQPTPAGEPA
jgi:hypothetical protein